MSTIVMAACWPLQNMSPAQKAVLISLADQANDDGVCWPSVSTIAGRTCLSERAVQDALAWLQTTGAVFREYRANTSTSYTIRPGRYDAAKAPAPRARAGKSTGADGAPGATGAPPADGAPRATGAPGGADGAPGGANGAPPEVQTAHPNHQGNRHRTVNEPLPAAAPPAKLAKAEKSKSPEEAETALQTACRAAWAAYSDAYETRYGSRPVRNAQVNAKVKQFVQRIGHDEAPKVARFYVEAVHDLYVTRECHPVGTLLQKAEGYRTQWAAGPAVQVSPARATAANAGNFNPNVHERRAATLAGLTNPGDHHDDDRTVDAESRIVG